ncbi:MAG: sulfite exporter TauE/SafE family protein [Candidatus Aenigmarchaeota archaeon]|nr:sulfite exporter TauE/SafE family protein [Candidatus Aenigmarchaeota archaeon]
MYPELVATFLVGIVASFIGAASGGGGLISLPALMFLGLPPQVAVATHKVGVLGVMTKIRRFHRAGLIDYGVVMRAAFFALVGSYAGSTTFLAVPNVAVEKLVGAALLVMLLLTIRKKERMKSEKPRKIMHYAGYIAFFFVGFASAFFAGIFAIFATYVLLHFFGKTFLESAGTRSVIGLATLFVSIAVFGSSGIINWPFGVALLGGNALGSHLGVEHALKKGDEWAKKIFVAVVGISSIALLIK